MLFASRWLLAPICLGLAAGLVLLLISFARQFVALVLGAATARGDETVIGVLSLIDLALMGGLLVMVIFASYESFVSRIDIGEHKDRPEWMGHVGFGDLKLKLMASIVAISAIHLLEDFMNISHLDNRELGWAVGIHMAFVASGVLLGLMDRLLGKDH